MEIHKPKIGIEDLQENELKVYYSLSDTTYGLNLVKAVSAKLFEMPSSEKNGYLIGGGIYHSHRDYCGVGMYYFEGKFTIGEVNDGMGPYPILITFENQEEFISWLTQQSDQSMSLITISENTYVSSRFNNQTISKIQLEYFLEEEYCPVWNAYCDYLRKRTEG